MDIQELRKIINLVRKKDIAPQKNILTAKSSTTRNRLLQGILTGEFPDDVIAAQTLYDEPATSKRYLMLRGALYDDIIQSLSAFNFSTESSPYQQTLIEAERYLIVIQAFLGLGQREIATSLAHRLLLKALHFEITDIAIKSLRVLRTSAMHKSNKALFIKYSADLKKLLALYEAEVQAEEVVESIEIQYSSSIERKKGDVRQAEIYLENIANEESLPSSFQLRLNRYRIQLYLFQIRHQFEEAIALCFTILNFLQQNPRFSTSMRQGEILSTAMTSSIRLRDYNRALDFGDKCLELIPVERPNRYIILGRMLLAALHSQNYDRALEIYTTASKNSQGFTTLKPFQKERWDIYHSYIALLSATGVISMKKTRLRREFSVASIISDLPEASEDKRGLNLPVLLLPVLYFTLKKDYEQVTSRIGILDKYSSRHLKKQTHPRTIIFLSMLKVLRRNNYNPEKAEGKAEGLYQELCRVPQDPDHIMEANEIVPYELLWLWILRRVKLNQSIRDIEY